MRTSSDRRTILTRICVACLVVASVSAWCETNRPADLLFSASFDRLTAFADYAAGKPECTLTESLELRAKPGVKGHCLLLQKGETCVYDGKDNIDIAAGTISLWVRPANWSDEDRRYVAFLNVYGRIVDSKRWFNLTIDKSDSPGTARAHVNFGGRRGDPDYRLYIALGSAKWTPDAWHKLDVTWDSKHLAIYVDGKLSDRQELPDVSIPKLVSSRIELCRQYPGAPESVRSVEDRTYIDEVQVYRGAQSPHRILQRYLADRPASAVETTPLTITAPKLERFTIDGVIDEGEERTAAGAPILTNVRTGLSHDELAQAFVGYNDQGVYVGLWSLPKTWPPVAKGGRDGRLWLDDSFEVFLSPGAEPTSHFYQFIINADGAVYDGRGTDGKWNAAGMRAQARRFDDDWSAELWIPFAALGVAAPQPGAVWRANFCRDYHRAAPRDPDYVTWSYGGPSYLKPEAFGRLRFSGEGSGAQLIVGPRLEMGVLDAHVACVEPTTVDIRVTSEGWEVWKTTREVQTEESFSARLSDAKLSLMTVAIRDRSGDLLQEYRTRFLVRQPISVTVTPDVAGKRLLLDIDLSRLPERWRQRVEAGTATLTITAEGPAGSHSEFSTPAGKTTVRAPLPMSFSPGRCQLTFALRDAGAGRSFTSYESIEIPDVSWFGSEVGVTDEVLSPWTPLQYGGDGTVSCWGRTYGFRGPLPVKMISQQQELLRGPITMALKTDGGEDILEAPATGWQQRAPHRTQRQGRARFGNTAVQVSWETSVEYDGLILSTVALTPPAGGIEVQSLTLQAPLRRGLRHIRGARKSPNRLEWNGRRWESGFEPFLWLTDEDRGFVYFCESEANWVYSSGQPVTIVEGGDQPALTLRIISQPVRLTKPLRYQFGFQATPVKPLMDGWRAMNFGPGTPVEHQTHQPWMNAYAYYTGLWETPQPEAVRKYDQERSKQGVLVFYYATTSCAATHNPVYRLFKPLWRDSFPAQFGPYRLAKNAFHPEPPVHNLAPVCPGAPSFVDYELWLAKRFHEQTGAVAFYTDTDGIWPCDNTAHGHGFIDAFGKRCLTYTILSKRRFAKRMAALCRSIQRDGQRGYWITHCHSKLVPPVHCFADFFWPGEEYTHRLYGNKWYYIADMPEVDYRVQLSGRTSGLVHVFLPEFKRGTKDPEDVLHPQPTESLLAMCAVNDVNCSAAYMHLPSMVEWWGLRKRLEIADADFIAYWRPHCPVKARPATARASVYRGKGRVVVPVANRAAEAAEVEVQVDLEALNLRGPLTARDERAGRPVRIDGDHFIVRVPARSYTFVSLAGS